MRKSIQLIAIAALTLSSFGAYTQNDLLFYTLKEVPQTTNINPANINPELFNVGVPFLSNGFVGFGNSGFRVNKLLRKRTDDSLAINVDDFVNNVLSKNNYLNINASYEILSGGYNWNKWYFTFVWTDKASAQIGYPRNLFQFLAEGNGAHLDETIEINRLKGKILHYREWAFGAARPIDDKWTVGAKVKVLWGKSSVYAKELNGSIYTDPDTYFITTTNSIDYNQSLPESITDSSVDFNYFRYGLGLKNPGMAIDLGASYKFDDKFTFSASILDLGSIRWKNNMQNYRSDEVSWTFKGIDINDYIGADQDVIDTKFKEFQDSLIDNFAVKKSETRFWTPLSPKVYLAASYVIDAQQTAGALLRTDFFNKSMHPQLSLSYMYKINQYFTTAASYSIGYRNWANLGLGFVANYGPMQFFLSSDNFIGAIAPASVRMTSVRFGFTYLHRQMKPVTAPRLN